jgi:hypothetical protein
VWAALRFCKSKEPTVKKVNLVQRTGIVPLLAYTQLPAVKQVPLAVDPNSYSRPRSAPTYAPNNGPAVRPPQTK